MTSRRHNLLFWTGMLLGVLLLAVAMLLVALYPSSFPEPAERRGRLPSVRAGNGVTLSFVTTGTARPFGFQLAQGMGVARYDIAFRAAVIDHPRGRVLFGLGVDPEGPSEGVFNPFGAITPEPLPELGELRGIILPTPRFTHLGGLERWPELGNTRIDVASSDLWIARSGPWPRRYGFERERVTDLGQRARSMSWKRTSRYGFGRSIDYFEDGSLLLLRARGTTSDEVALMVTVDSGARYLLVGDAIWTRPQLDNLLPRSPWLNWLWDRNRMQLANLQRNLTSLSRTGRIHVIPMLDGREELPEYPEVWR